MENNKMTAVECFMNLVGEQPSKGYYTINGLDVSKAFNQAIQMEKKQHDDTWNDSRVNDKGENYIGKQKTFEQYYKQTYGK